jgi:hypothetical protein
LDVLGRARWQDRRYDGIIERSIKRFFDSISQELPLRIEKKHLKEQWMVFSIECWRKAPWKEEEGPLVSRVKDMPRSGIVSV